MQRQPCNKHDNAYRTGKRAFISNCENCLWTTLEFTEQKLSDLALAGREFYGRGGIATCPVDSSCTECAFLRQLEIVEKL